MRVIIASSVNSPGGIQLTNIEPEAGEPYAILSHTWGADGDEVLYTDIFDGKARSRVAYESKVAFACRRAVADGYQYVWIDTCCIDKSSSAELSEAINSMFRWYRKSAVCYALLSDVPGDTTINDSDSGFAKAKWFTRGFTLQELLAPSNVIFYSREWIELGTKASLSLALASITRVDIGVLTGHRPIEAASIANRMGWAANRVTKRPEDIAYCLMGIFSVNMPLLYGEGSKAFIRLQEEIMRSSTDHSLFAWIDEDAPEDEFRGVLAQSPSMFSKTSTVSPFTLWERQEPYSMTNMGLSIQLPVNKVLDSWGVFVACFDCPAPDTSNEAFFGVFLKKLYALDDDMRFVRIRAATYCPVTVYQYSERRDIYLSSYPSPPPHAMALPAPLFQRPLIRLEGRPLWPRHRLASLTVYPGGHTYSQGHKYLSMEKINWPLHAIYLREGANQISCAMLLKPTFEDNDGFFILIGSGYDATNLAYHVADLREDFGEADYPSNKTPDLRELELFYEKPRPMGEAFQVGSSQVCVWQTQQQGREHTIKISVEHVTAPKKGASETESSSNRVRHLLKLNR